MTLEQIYSKGTAKQLWEAWDPAQRSHFLIDHYDMFGSALESDVNKYAQKFSHSSYNDLPKPIKKELVIHHAMGIYGEGAVIKSEKLSPMKQKLAARIAKLQSLKDGLKSEGAKKAIQNKINKLQKQLDYKPTLKENISNFSSQHALDVPTTASKKIYRKLWEAGIKPKLHTLNGTTSVIVKDQKQLAKAYTVYSSILGSDAKPLSKISRKL